MLLNGSDAIDMNVILNRIDERLVHGQVLASWIRKKNVKRLLVVDDRLANDRFVETVLKMSLPSGIELQMMDVIQTVEYLRRNQDGRAPQTILLMRTPQTAKMLWDAGYKPKEINIGGIPAGEARRNLCSNVYVTEEEIEIFRNFIENGTEVFVQVVFAEPRINFKVLI